MRPNYFVWILLAMQWIVGVSTIGQGIRASCCTETSTKRVRVEEIVSYSHQDEPLCTIKAVRFRLTNDITICSDPKDVWAKHAIKVLDRGTTRKAPNTPPSWTSTSRTETTTSTSSPGTSTESTTIMTTPKGTSTTWKPTTYITHRSSTKQLLGNTIKPQWTTTQITSMEMTTTTDRKPLTTDIKTTSMTTTTESPVTMTTPKETSTRWKPTTYITHRSSTKELPENTSKPPQWTTTQIMTRKESTTMERKSVTPETKTTSMTMTTENKVTMTTPKGTSTTERPVQKPSTRNVEPRRTRCPPFVTTKQDKSSSSSGKKKIPWTVRRLRKKMKKGLRRAQMNLRSDTVC